MRGLFLLVVGLVVACGTNHHITVPPLPPQATPAQRLDIWRHWHSRAQGIETETTCGNNGCSTKKTALLQLEGGVLVRHPEDLRPLIDEHSDSARALARLEKAQKKRHNYKVVAYLGFPVFLVSCVMAVAKGSASWFFVGGGAGIGMATVGGVGMYLQNDDILEASTKAFERYDRGLATKLRLCVKGLYLVPCEMETPGTMSVPIDEGGGDEAIQALPQR